MTAKTKKQPFTTFRFERNKGTTENHRIYAVEKTKHGTFLLFTEDEVLEVKTSEWGKLWKPIELRADAPLTTEDDWSLICVCLSDFPETITGMKSTSFAKTQAEASSANSSRFP